MAIALFMQSNAQCFTDEYQKELLESSPEIKAQYDYYREHGVPGDMVIRQTAKGKKAVRIIPVVFHVIHTYGAENISKEQILDQLVTLNEDFRRMNADTSSTREIFKDIAADMEIEFQLAHTAPDGGCTDGITRTYSTLTDGGDDLVKTLIRWDYRKYLNIWVVERIARNWNPPSFVAGYAVFPFATDETRDGIVIRHDFVGSIGTSDQGRAGRTLTHEIGHWLGLYHPFQGGCTSTFTWTDQVDDTPPVAQPSYRCPIGNNTCHNDDPDQLDMVENYMDYADGSCQNLFTIGQKDRVDGFLSNDAYRGLNVSAKTISQTGVNLDTLCPPIADFYTENLETVVCQSSGTLTFVDYSYNADVTSRTWYFPGGTPEISTEESPQVSWNEAGVYSVKLVSRNASGADSVVRDGFITVLPLVSLLKAPYAQTFESVNFDIGWTVESDGSGGWRRTTVRASDGIASMECRIDANTVMNTSYSLTLPPIDMTQHGSPVKLNFNHAYSRRLSNNTEVLFIRVSDDCGETWKNVKGYSASNGLATIAGNNEDWVPTSPIHWGFLSVDLSAYASSTNLMITIDVLARGGNSVFIDNIHVAQFGLGLPQPTAQNLFNIVPNPAQDNILITVSQAMQNSTMEIRDLSGRLLLQSQILGDELVVNTSDFADGMYVVSVMQEGIRRTQKLIISR